MCLVILISLFLSLTFYFLLGRKTFVSYDKALSYTVGVKYKINSRTFIETRKVDRTAINTYFTTNNYGGVILHSHDFDKDVLVTEGEITLTITDGFGHSKSCTYSRGDLFRVGMYTLNSIKAKTKNAGAYITCYNPNV
jgi:hypothetical protein